MSASQLPPRFDCAVIGDWHLAHVIAPCIASLGKRTLLVTSESASDSDYPKSPIDEPGLSDLIRQGREAGRLEWVGRRENRWSAEFIWVAIDTPVDDSDVADVSVVRSAIVEIARNHPDSKVIVSSQVHLGFCEGIQKELGVPIVYIPENVRLGQGVETFLNADRTVLGANDRQTGDSVRAFLSSLHTDFIACDLPTAEMVKHATNAFLATSISFGNEIARIGSMCGVDSDLVMSCLKRDLRIGNGAYISPGLGFSGGTLPRDLKCLQALGRNLKIPTPLVDATLWVNQQTTQSIVDAIRRHCGTLDGRAVLILGYTYKAEANTLRRSLSVELATQLESLGCFVGGYDPVMNEKDLLQLTRVMTHYPEWKNLDRNFDAVILMTYRPQFSGVDWNSLARNADEGPCLILDTRSELSAAGVRRPGLAYRRLWEAVR